MIPWVTDGEEVLDAGVEGRAGAGDGSAAVRRIEAADAREKGGGPAVNARGAAMGMNDIDLIGADETDEAGQRGRA